MASRDYDKWLTLGLGIFAFVAVKCVSWQLGRASQLSHAASEEAQAHAKMMKKADEIAGKKKRKMATEDDISLSTLAVLVDCPNYDIRQAATKILLHRFTADPDCLATVRKDYHSSDEKGQALSVLRTLEAYDMVLHVESIISGSTVDEGLNLVESMLTALGLPDDPTGHSEDADIPISRLFRRRLDRASERVAAESGQSAEEAALRRWQRREAMIVEVDEDGATELVEPS